MFTSISKFSTEGKESHSIASKLEGDLLISRSVFPYFALVAFEAGGPVRALILLSITPVVCVFEWLYGEKLALQLMMFVSLLGLKADDVKAVAKSVLPRFYLNDIRCSAYRVLSSCGGEKYVVTAMPRIMVEAFLQEYLNINYVIGAELRFFGPYCLGLAAKPEQVMGSTQSRATLGGATKIDIDEHAVMRSCQERYIVPTDDIDDASPLPRSDYPKPLIFHDGRLVARPTPLDLLAVFLWIPLGIVLAILRSLIALLVPYKLQPITAAAFGMINTGKIPPNPNTRCDPERGTFTLYVSSHRTLIDPIVLAGALQQNLTAVTYSISRISEFLSPITTVRLSRDRTEDGKTMQELLKKGDLVICPEGTTCREPYLLRFSLLFAEIGDVIVPVAIETESSMFYGTTVRGYKWLDSFFFLMNPNPTYKILFLEKLSGIRTSEKKSSSELANLVQKTIGNALGFECTNLTRKDKYRVLAGNDGRVTKI